MGRREQDRLAAGALARSRGTTRWRRVACPFCELDGKRDTKGSLSINSESGYYQCWRCDTRGFIEEGLEGFELERDDDAPPPNLGPPAEFYPLWRAPGATAKTFAVAREYLRGRVPDEEWQSLGLGAVAPNAFGKAAGRVVIPVRNERKEWLGWVGRLPTKKKVALPYYYPPGMSTSSILYNQHILQVETDEPALVVEGVFDAIAVRPHGVAVFGKPREGHFDLLADAKRPVVFVLDGDSWEESLALAMRLRLLGVSAGSVRLPTKADPDEVPLEWLRSQARAALEE